MSENIENESPLKRSAKSDERVTLKHNKKALIISSQKWNGILKSLNKDEEINKTIEDERKFKEYLKKGSEEIKSKWPNKVPSSKTNQEKIEQQKRKIKEKMAKDEQEYKQLQKYEEKCRQEKIETAKKLIQQMKPGPRELDSAAMCSEVIHGREIQKHIKNEFDKIVKENEKKEDEKFQVQANKWIQEQKTKHIETKNRNEKYRNDLQNQIFTNQKQKQLHEKNTMQLEQQIRQQTEKTVQAQIEKEKNALERKREALRKNALEAMKMVEQRRLREQMEEEVENKIVEIFDENKQKIANLRKGIEKEIKDEKIKKIEENFNKLTMKERQTEDEAEARRKKAIEEFYAKLDDQEKVRIVKARKRKADLIKAHFEEIEKKKQAEAAKKVEQYWEKANRLKNEEVNRAFYRAKTEQKNKTALEIQSTLRKQMEEKLQQQRREKEIDKLCIDQSGPEEDAYFMNYANNLIRNAKMNSRPVWPIERAVQQYKWCNHIDLPKAGSYRNVPPHLQSSFSIRKVDCPTLTKKSDEQIIRYNLDQLKQMNPYANNYHKKPLWA